MGAENAVTSGDVHVLVQLSCSRPPGVEERSSACGAGQLEGTMSTLVDAVSTLRYEGRDAAWFACPAPRRTRPPRSRPNPCPGNRQRARTPRRNSGDTARSHARCSGPPRVRARAAGRRHHRARGADHPAGALAGGVQRWASGCRECGHVIRRADTRARDRQVGRVAAAGMQCQSVGRSGRQAACVRLLPPREESANHDRQPVMPLRLRLRPGLGERRWARG
jgi:hypothetical protein